MSVDFKKLNVAVVSHILTSGPADELVKYLKGRAGKTTYIGHPFAQAGLESSFHIIYRGKECVKKHSSPVGKLPGIFNYIKDFLLTLLWLSGSGKQDLYIGVNNLNAACGIVLRKMGRVKKVVFYTIDYVHRRFRFQPLNKIYHFFDRFAVRHSDFVWNLSGRMIIERERSGISPKYRDKQIRVPIGTALDSGTLQNKIINRYDIAFMGHLREGQGLGLLLEVFADVLTKIPEARLQIFGAGPLDAELRQKAIDLGIDSKVNFHGRIESHRSLLSALSKCAIAVAPYEDTEECITRFTDPGKPKAYLSAGLPVVITRVPEISQEIEKERCGRAVNYDREEIAKAVIELLADEQKLRALKENTKVIAGKYEWTKVFDGAFNQIY